jgi:ribosomal protein S8
MVLGQKGSLEKLKSWGFITDFDGIDQSYDNVADDKERFLQFHLSLRNWCVQDSEIRRTAIYKWNNIIQHNFQNYKKLNFKKTMFDNVILSTEQYFKKCF